MRARRWLAGAMLYYTPTGDFPDPGHRTCAPASPRRRNVSPKKVIQDGSAEVDRCRAGRRMIGHERRRASGTDRPVTKAIRATAEATSMPSKVADQFASGPVGTTACMVDLPSPTLPAHALAARAARRQPIHAGANIPRANGHWPEIARRGDRSPAERDQPRSPSSADQDGAIRVTTRRRDTLNDAIGQRRSPIGPSSIPNFFTPRVLPDMAKSRDTLPRSIVKSAHEASRAATLIGRSRAMPAFRIVIARTPERSRRHC